MNAQEHIEKLTKELAAVEKDHATTSERVVANRAYLRLLGAEGSRLRTSIEASKRYDQPISIQTLSAKGTESGEDVGTPGT